MRHCHVSVIQRGKQNSRASMGALHRGARLADFQDRQHPMASCSVSTSTAALSQTITCIIFKLVDADFTLCLTVCMSGPL